MLESDNNTLRKVLQDREQQIVHLRACLAQAEWQVWAQSGGMPSTAATSSHDCLPATDCLQAQQPGLEPQLQLQPELLDLELDFDLDLEGIANGQAQPGW